jgi:predicted porin
MKIVSIFTIGAATALCAISPALANPMDFTVGGYFTQSVQLVDIDDCDGQSFEDEVLAQDAEIHFKGKTMLNNGTELGIRVELEASESDDQIDEHYLYLKGDWGKLILGAENGIGHLMQVRAPRFVPGLKMFDNSITEDVYESAYDGHLEVNAIEDAHMSTKLEHISGDANKLSYLTPLVGGLQLGASFAPNNANRAGGENNAGASTASTQEDIVELGVSYKGTMRGVGYKFSYTGVEGDTETPNRKKPKSTSTGLALSYGDWVFGGNMSEYEDISEVYEDSEADDATPYLINRSVTTTDEDDIDWSDSSQSIETSNYALKYKMGDSHIGIGFTESEENRPIIGISIAEGGTLGSDNEIGGTTSSTRDGPTSKSFTGRLKTSYEEMMIGYGTKLSPAVSLGLYYSISEAEHETLAVSGGIATDAIAVPGGNDTPGMVTDFGSPDKTKLDASEVSSLGITLNLLF